MGDWDFSLFGVFRRFLFIFLTVYTCLKLGQFFYRRQWELVKGARYGSMYRRYLVIHLMRIPINRFAVDLVEIGILLVVLLWLVSVHAYWR